MFQIPKKNGAKSFPTTGNRKLLLILANFSNTTTTYTQAQFNNYMNQTNYNGTGSFKDFFLECSYGTLTMTTTVTAWVTLPNTHDYYGPDANWGEFAYDAVVAANSTVDYSQFDNDGDGTVDGVAIIHQGPGQESTGSTDDIWSHSYDLTSAGYSVAQRTFDGVKVNSYTAQPELIDGNMTTVGVMCHEFGHNLGAPDFYDTDYDETGNGQYEGTGEWDLQASGCWNGTGYTSALMGNKPAQPNAYTKCYIYNWATPTILSTGATVTLNNSTQNAGSFYRFNTNTANEYFLLENRQKVGFDAYVPGHGLLIYHVDGSYVSSHSSSNDINISSHQGMYIIPANSTVANGIAVSASTTLNSTGAPYPGSASKTSFTDVTTPNSKSWANANTAKPITSITENTTNKTVTLNFMGGGSGCTPVAITTQPATTQSACAPGGASFTVAATTGTAPITYQWQYYNGSTWSSVANGIPAGATYTNATAATMTVTGITTAATYQYRCYLTNCSGANNATSTTASLTIKALPTAQFTYNASGLTVTFTNTSTNASSYSWNFGSGTSTTASPVYTFPSSGQYTVTLTANNQGCTSTTTQTINVTGTGIASNSNQNLTIYPNPAHGVITIQLDAESNTKQLSIYDIEGRLVYQKILQSLKEDIDLSHLNYGAYEVKINLDNRVLHQRLILK